MKRRRQNPQPQRPKRRPSRHPRTPLHLLGPMSAPAPAPLLKPQSLTQLAAQLRRLAAADGNWTRRRRR